MSGQHCENYDVTVTREMLNAVARDQSVQLKVADVVAGISQRFPRPRHGRH